MKAKIPFFMAAVALASSSWAMACNHCSHSSCPAPVKEQIMAPACPAAPPIVSEQTLYKPECPTCYWVPPRTDNPVYIIGNVLTAPLRLLTGRSLGQPDVVATYSSAEPVAERVTTLTTATRDYRNACGELRHRTTLLRKNTELMPVGERLTTIKVIKTKPMPVAESTCPITTIAPVAAPRCPTLGSCSTGLCPRMEPVGERVIFRSEPAPACSQAPCPSASWSAW